MAFVFLLFTGKGLAQEKSVKDLNFLIGEWKVREDIPEKNWWEESTRIVRYALDSTFIELDCRSISSGGKKRTYRWYIHYNRKKQQFEMVSMFSNWHKVQFDMLYWDAENRELTIRNAVDLNSTEYHERFGVMTFNENLNGYIWKGENKYGDAKNPGIWRYIEKGQKIE